MTKLDYEKRRRRPVKGVRSGPAPSALRQQALAAFVERHKISCFKCGSGRNDWAKTGTNARGPWAICAPCTHKR